MLISVVIPTYNEPNIHETLAELVKQTVFQKYPKEVEIIVADQDPEKNQITENSFIQFLNKFNHPSHDYRLINVDRKGIAYGRHNGIINSDGKVIVNFDADAKFSTVDAIEKLTEPILKGEVTITCCDNILDNALITDLETQFTVHAFALFNQIQRDNLIVCLEPGMCFTRHAYDYVGGFNDVKQGEALFLSPRIIYNFGLFCKRHIPDTAVISSARRINAIGKVGLLNAINYDNAFRI